MKATVTVLRTATGTADIGVEIPDRDLAGLDADGIQEVFRDKALEAAGDTEFSMDDASYEADTVVIEGDGVVAKTVRCSLCGKQTAAKAAHLHQGEWIGDECWDERLRASE